MFGLRKHSKEKPAGPKSRMAKKISEFRLSRSPNIVVLPVSNDEAKPDVFYGLIEPFASVRIRWDKNAKELLYSISEPDLSEDEVALLQKLVKGLIEIIDVELASVRMLDKAVKYLESKVRRVMEELEMDIPEEKYQKIMYYIFRDLVGLNEIEPMMHDPYLEDIGCDGTGIPLYVVHSKYGSLRTNVVFGEEEKLKDFVIKLSERCNRYVSYAEPLLDGSLLDGSRVQASLASDVTTKGPTFSIRKFKEKPLSPPEVCELNTASPEMLAYLWYCVESKSNVLVCGGVSTGKTTMLNVLSMFVPYSEKVISIEDTRELQLTHDNWIPSVSREGFGAPIKGQERYGEVTLFDLLKESFRQNPDYVIVGEVRGQEAYVMFQGMSSGHSCMGTMHAGSIETLVKRLQTPPIELPPSLIESLDIVVLMAHAKEKGKSARRVKEINEVRAFDRKSGDMDIVNTFRWNPSDDTYDSCSPSWVLQKICVARGMKLSDTMKELKRREDFIELLLKKGVTDYAEVSGFIRLYSKNRGRAMEMMSELPDKSAAKSPDMKPKVSEKEGAKKPKAESSSPKKQAGRKNL